MNRLYLVCGTNKFFRLRKDGGLTEDPQDATTARNADDLASLLRIAMSEYPRETFHLKLGNLEAGATKEASPEFDPRSEKRALIDNLTEGYIKGLWYKAGGQFHGPHTETATMEASKFFAFIRNLMKDASGVA